VSADGDGGGSGDDGGGGIGMQPSEEFRPLPHIYLNARRGAARRSAARRQRDLGRARSAGPPFIVRQPRGLDREEGVQIKERGSKVTEKEREREMEMERGYVRGQCQATITTLVYRFIQECPRCFVIGRIRKIFL